MIKVQNLEFGYARDSFQLQVDSLTIDDMEQVAIVGPSGCGKTTLLHLIAGILAPPKQAVIVDGTDLGTLSETARRRFRITNIGLVFQEFELVEYLNVIDNVLLPCRIHSNLPATKERRQRALKLIEAVGLRDKTHRNVTKLSQGERQRAAICRALLPAPKLLLADEPTGNLDPDNKSKMIQLLAEQARESRASLLVVTHDHSLLSGFDRVIQIEQLGKTIAVNG